MTNKELQNSFRVLIHESESLFDIYMVLEDLNKDFKTTPFYKKTKKTIYEAFELYLRGIGQIDYIAHLLSATDIDDMNSAINIIAESLNFDNILNTMSAEDKEIMLKVLPFLQK